MKLIYLIVIVSLLTTLVSAQSNYEAGYYIDTAGQRQVGQIDNKDWNAAPKRIQFRNSLDVEAIALVPAWVVEVGTQGGLRYRSVAGQVLELPQAVFAQVLVEGVFSLLRYRAGSEVRYLLAGPEPDNVTLLIGGKGVAAERRNSFRYQVRSTLTCSDGTAPAGMPQYTAASLVAFVSAYHECTNTPYTVYLDDTKQSFQSHIDLRLGTTSSTTEVDFGQEASRFGYGRQLGLRIGVLFELVLPFHNGRWSVYTEPTYRTHTDEVQRQVFPGTNVPRMEAVTLTYHSIELPLAVRRYFRVTEGISCHVDGAFVLDFSGDSNIAFETKSDIDLNAGPNFMLGLGILMHRRYGVQLLYYTPRDLTANFETTRTEHRAVTVLIGYRFR